MATVDMNHVEFWEPPSAILSDKQRQAASPYWDINFSLISDSRNHPVPPHTEAEGIACYSLDTTSCDDADASDYFPTIEEILSSISHKEIRSEGHHDTEDLGANLDEPALGQSTSPPSLVQSRSDHTTNHCEGTRNRPVVLEDDDSDSTDAENETETASTSTSSDLNAVDITQDSIPDSTLLGRDACDPRALAPSSADAGGDFDCGHTLDDEQGQCTEPEPLVPASALSQPSSPICATEALCIPANQQSYSANLHSRSEDIQRGPTFDALLKCGEHLQEKQQEWKKRDRRGDGYMQGDAEDVEGGEDELLQEPKIVEAGEQQTITNTGTKVSNAIRYSLHDTSDEDDEGPRRAKRRRMSPASHLVSLTPTSQNGPQPRLRWSPSRSSPVTRDDGLTHTENRHGSHPSADVGHSYLPHSSLSASPSVVAEATQTGGAEYHEWGLQHGSLKRTKIGEQTIFTLEFSLEELHDLLALQASSHVPLYTCQTKTTAMSAQAHRLAAQIKRGRPSKRQRGRRCTFTTDDDIKLVDLKEVQGLSWKDIALQFPGRSLGGLQVRYCTKLKNRRLSDEDDSDSED